MYLVVPLLGVVADVPEDLAGEHLYSTVLQYSTVQYSMFMMILSGRGLCRSDGRLCTLYPTLHRWVLLVSIIKIIIIFPPQAP